MRDKQHFCVACPKLAVIFISNISIHTETSTKQRKRDTSFQYVSLFSWSLLKTYLLGQTGSMSISSVANVSKILLVSVGLWKCYEVLIWNKCTIFCVERRTDRAMLLHCYFARGHLCHAMPGKMEVLPHLYCTRPCMPWQRKPVNRGHLRKCSHIPGHIKCFSF